MMRCFLLTIVALELSGCATPNISKDTLKLESAEGILVTNIVTNAGGYKLVISKSNSPHFTILNISSGENFRVIALSAGNYTWARLTSGVRRSEFLDRYNFKVVAGMINYIGDMHIEFEPDVTRFRIAFEGHDREVWQRFEESYPGLSASYRFTSSLPQPAPPESSHPYSCGLCQP